MKKKSTEQWKVVQGIQTAALEKTLDKYTELGWAPFSILGPLNTGLVIVFRRFLTL